MLKKTASLVGWVLLVAGVLGFVPGITNDEMLLGIFQVNTMNNVLHIVVGLLGLYLASKGEDSAQMFFKVAGVIYGLLAVLGFFAAGDMVLGMFANNDATMWLHVVLAVAALYFGFGAKKENSMQTV